MAHPYFAPVRAAEARNNTTTHHEGGGLASDGTTSTFSPLIAPVSHPLHFAVGIFRGVMTTSATRIHDHFSLALSLAWGGHMIASECGAATGPYPSPE